MKLFAPTVTLLIIGTGVILYTKHPWTKTEEAAVPQSAAPATSALNRTSVVEELRTRTQAKKPRSQATTDQATPAPAEIIPGVGNDNMTLNRAIATLISPQANFQVKEKIWKQLQETGELDHALAELKQRAADYPNDPQILTALGEAGVYKLRTVTDFNERAILALQSDQSFNSVLKIDPANWEAQYYKAASMSHWPESLHKDDEVVQRLTALAAQQEKMTSEPQFARTYIVLGDEYKKLGKLDEAEQTWRLGTEKFPKDPALQKRLAEASH